MAYLSSGEYIRKNFHLIVGSELCIHIPWSRYLLGQRYHRLTPELDYDMALDGS